MVYNRLNFMVFFFFQAEDGIRDFHVTGVQTCALPISSAEVFSRMGGVETAVAQARQHAGAYYDPGVVDRFCDVAEPLYQRLEAEQPWDAVLSAEPAPLRWLSQAEVDTV